MSTPPIRAAIYYRVSTNDQSPQMQMKELRSYAKKRKFEVAGEYVDTVSGAARTRPELDHMMDDSKPGRSTSFWCGRLTALRGPPLTWCQR